MTTTHQPIIINLGSKKKKHIRRLKKGRGKLMAEVNQVISEVENNLREEGGNEGLLPVVVLYRRKRKKSRGLLPLF